MNYNTGTQKKQEGKKTEISQILSGEMMPSEV